MQRYAARLSEEGETVDYVDYVKGEPVTQRAIATLAEAGTERLICANPVDFILEKRLSTYAAEHQLELILLDTPGF